MRPSPLAVALALVIAAGPATAQQNVAPSRLDAQPGAPYAVGTFEDWQVRCIRTDDPANDPCQMSQQLLSGDGSPTAEISVFPVPNNARAVAVATVVTPLETLLPRGIEMGVDDSPTGTHPFQFCNRQGCVGQIGLPQAELDAMKAGTAARVRIYAVGAPQTPVDLTLSLAGFTAAYDSMAPLPGLE